MSDYKTVQEVKGIDANLAVPFRCILILLKKKPKVAKNGNPFLSLEFGDRSGRFNANCFSDSDVFNALKDVEEGSIVRLAGKTDYYQDAFHLGSKQLRRSKQLRPKQKACLTN
jgi:3'-5' exoribonuclease